MRFVDVRACVSPMRRVIVHARVRVCERCCLFECPYVFGCGRARVCVFVRLCACLQVPVFAVVRVQSVCVCVCVCVW